MYKSSIAVAFLLFVLMINATENLLNGQDLTGWEVDGTEKWYVDNSVLVAESGPDEAYGYLKIKKNYKNFELELFRSSLEGTKNFRLAG